MQTSSPSPATKPLLRVENLWVRKGGPRRRKWILKDINFEVKPGEFVAIIGPNGAGKTKLMEAIIGDRPYAGQVSIYNQDLYANPEHWLRHIGWVPSYNVLHDTLRVEQALLQIGRLRLPARDDAHIRRRVKLLLDQLEFPEGRRQALIRELSSGERKRLDLCAELLTNPPLLLLDEPTTNLDPDAERALMELLRNRSWGKRQTVVVVTHTLQSLYYCDRVIFMGQGRIRAQGSYDQVLAQLEAEFANGDPAPAAGGTPSQPAIRPASVESEQASGEDAQPQSPPHSFIRSPSVDDDASRWADIYRKSRRYDPQGELSPPATTRGQEQPAGSKRKIHSRPRSWVHEFWVLLRRNWMLFANNVPALGLYFLLGPFSGLLSRLVLRDNAFIQDTDVAGYSAVFDTTDARQAVFIIALVVTLLGLIGSFLDVIKERQIYHYERVKGLSPWAYLLSKWVVLVVLVGILAPSTLLVVLTFQGQSLPSTPYVLVTLYLACIASVTLGLAISAASSSERTATGLLGIVVVFYLFFSGGVDFNERLRAFLERLSVFASSHWAAEGISTSIQMYCWAANPRLQDFYSFGHLFAIWLYLLVYILAALILGLVALRLQDTWFSQRERLNRALVNGHIVVLLPLLLVAFSWAFFFEARSRDFFYLREDEDTVRVEYSLGSLFGYVSQSQCPLPTPLPPPSTTVMRALPPTPVPLQPTQALAQAPTATVEMQPTPVVPQVTYEEGFAPLPVGALVRNSRILFGPEHADFPLELLPENSSFLLLGKDQSGQWFRIKEQFTGRQLVGWVLAPDTSALASQTGVVASPPRCAIPRAYLESDEAAPLADWTSDVSGSVVAVVDLFRDEPGPEVSVGRLFVERNGEVISSHEITPSHHSFLFRGLVVEVPIAQDDQLRLILSEAPLPGEVLHLRASIFFVPSGCSL
ncbi:MAG: ABC transporter ATP-binding protein/permease [Chloroflexota bacterium]